MFSQSYTSNSDYVPIFVVSLSRSRKRREYMQFQMSRLGLDFVFFNAVDGASLSSQTTERIQRHRHPMLYKKRFTSGEIGCALSHMEVYRTIVHQNIPASLILEDDVFITRACKQMLCEKTISQLPQDWDIVLLAYVQEGNRRSMPYKGAATSWWHRKKVGDVLYVGTPVQFCYHAAGYLVSRKGAALLLKHGMPIRMPADILTGNAAAYGMRLYTVSTPVIRQHHGIAAHSTIKKNVVYHVNGKKNYKTHLKNIGKKYKIVRMCWRIWVTFFQMIMNVVSGNTFPFVLLRKIGILPARNRGKW